jgi:Tfp pilus assembly protein PilO
MEWFPLTFTKRNLAFLGICLGFLVFLVLITITPLLTQQKDLSQKLIALQGMSSKQAQLVPVLQAIDQKLQTLATLDKLPAVAQEPLSIMESSSIMDQIRSLSLEQNVKLIQITPIIPKSSENLKELTFESYLQGSAADIRSFVYSLLQISFIEKIDALHIQTNDNTLDLNLVFSVRII